MQKTELDIYREEIDSIDTRLLALLAKREEIVKNIGRYKKQNNLPALNPQRKQQVTEKFKTKAAELNLSQDFALKLYGLIHDRAIELEEEI